MNLEALFGFYSKEHMKTAKCYQNQNTKYVSYNDGIGVIKYYNMQTCKVLTSQNFHTINPPEEAPTPEHIEVTPNLPYEGESVGDTLMKGVTTSDDITQKLEPKESVNKMK